MGRLFLAGTKKSLINDILLLFMASMVLLSGTMLLLQFRSYRNKFIKESEFIKDNYNSEQMELVKREVERAVELINGRISSLDERVESIVRERVYEVHSIIGNIYSVYSGTKSDGEIIQMIKEIIRPIRFNEDQGYFFITDMKGRVILNANQPEIEGHNLLENRNAGVRKTMEDMVSLLQTSTEARYSYLWTKPGVVGDRHQKISFIKKFEPYDWIIGTGLYTKDVEEVLKTSILYDISQIRFSSEGAIFINSLDGDALLSNGVVLEESRKLWEQSDTDEQAMRDLFKKELNMSMTPSGGYIYHEFQKLGDSDELSTKVSFIYGLRELNWLIGAGIYLDDVQTEIASLQKLSRDEYFNELATSLALTFLILMSFLTLLIAVRKRLRRDFLIFDSFFDKAVNDDLKINTDVLKFKEFCEMAQKANKMQHDKLEAQKSLVEGREQFRNSEIKFRLLAENSRDMIYRMSFPEGIYDYVSPAAEEILGYSPAEIMKTPFFVLNHIHSDWEKWVRDKFSAMVEGKTDEVVEFKAVKKDGEEIWVSQKLSFIRDDSSEIRAIVGRLSDETKRKKIEEQLYQSNKLEAIGQLAGGVAHDFNNLLMGIINAAQYLKLHSGDMEDEGDKMVDLIINATTRAADLISKLSTFSRKRSLVLMPVDIHAIIDETAVILRETINRRMTLHVEKNASQSFVQGDAAELQSALINLGINSSHALGEGGDISIETANLFLDQEYCDSVSFHIHPGQFIQIKVSDNGCGISSEHLPRIFEPYFSTREQGKGTGLGLSIVYGVIFDHNGAIFAESEEERGTTFVILIPCISEKPKEILKPLQSGNRTEQILLVDDEPIIRVTGKSLLEKMGYSVLVAESGRRALEIYREEGPNIDLVLVDFMMPQMNGSELFYKIREINPGCKIIMISGYTRDENIEKLKRDGLLGFMKKPFRYDELNKLISDLLD